MEIKDLNDFYIDLDGDIKASNKTHDRAVFVTNTDKPDSEYIIAKSVDEIKEALNEVNPTFELDIEIFKQYSIKRDKDNNVISVKIFADNTDKIDNLDVVLVGYEISPTNVIRDYYFIGNISDVNNFIRKNQINYIVQEYETHKHFLYSIKYDQSNKIINFKTYYIVNQNIMYYTGEMIPHIKKSLRFI